MTQAIRPQYVQGSKVLVSLCCDLVHDILGLEVFRVLVSLCCDPMKSMNFEPISLRFSFFVLWQSEERKEVPGHLDCFSFFVLWLTLRGVPRPSLFLSNWRFISLTVFKHLSLPSLIEGHFTYPRPWPLDVSVYSLKGPVTVLVSFWWKREILSDPTEFLSCCGDKFNERFSPQRAGSQAVRWTLFTPPYPPDLNGF